MITLNKEILSEFIEGLPREQKAVVILKVNMSLTSKEISIVTSYSENKVERLLKKVYKKLKNKFIDNEKK